MPSDTRKIITAIVLTAFIVGVGVWCWQKSLFEIEKEGIEQQINVLENKINNLEGQKEQKNWRTYRNEEYGFEIKYPSYFTFYEIPQDPGSDSFEVDIEGWVENNQAFNLQISIKSSLDYMVEYILDGNLELNGNVFTRYRGFIPNSSGTAEDRPFLKYEIKEKNLAIRSSVKNQVLTEQILSTFKFIR